MPRSIWRGVISFGMVSIPVRLYTATESKDIAFRQLHEADHARIQMKRFCTEEDAEVDYGEIVRGYEYAKDRYVVLEDEDFDKLPLPSKHTIALDAFVQAEEIDPIYYEKAYYLEPEEAGTKPFALLMRALEEKQLVAVAKIAIRNKERLCALRPSDNVLALETMYHADEIREAPGEVDWQKEKVSDAELKMAYTLIDMLAKPFEPEQYEDDYREALMQVIKAKLDGVEIEEEAPAVQAPKVVDLMAALKASVEAARSGGGSARSAAEQSAALDGAGAQDDADAEEKPKRRASAKGGTRTASRSRAKAS
jgi:DNA end-binding protein Ku